MVTDEKMLFTNTFGTVTDRRVILNYKSGAEDIQLAQVSSVRYKHVRSLFFSIGGFAVSVFVLIGMLSLIDRAPGVFVLICVVVVILGFLSGLANWYGHHEIIVSIGGNDRKPLKAELAKTKEGRQFVDAIRNAIVKV